MQKSPLKIATGIYYLGERSLGFRWFFVFSLLTTYRAMTSQPDKGLLLLLDEPASNLHRDRTSAAAG